MNLHELEAENEQLFKVHIEALRRGRSLALRIIQLAADGDPLGMLDAAAEYLNSEDAVADGDVELYEIGKARLGLAIAKDRDDAVEIAEQHTHEREARP